MTSEGKKDKSKRHEDDSAKKKKEDDVRRTTEDLCGGAKTDGENIEIQKGAQGGESSGVVADRIKNKRRNNEDNKKPQTTPKNKG